MNLDIISATVSKTDLLLSRHVQYWAAQWENPLPDTNREDTQDTGSFLSFKICKRGGQIEINLIVLGASSQTYWRRWFDPDVRDD